VADQLLRSGTGLAANAEEAKAAYSRREFALKNSYALKEGREARFWLRLIIRCHLAAEEEQAAAIMRRGGRTHRDSRGYCALASSDFDFVTLLHFPTAFTYFQLLPSNF